MPRASSSRPRPQDRDRVAALEMAFDRADARGQQAAPGPGQRLRRARVDDQAALGCAPGEDPALAVLQRHCQRRETRAQLLATRSPAG